MKEYFSIGEIAKLHNLTVETLRHYDRFGLLKPTHINNKTGYRYYSTRSFNKIDLIKQCRAIGLSLNEIKEIIDDYTSLDSILKVVNNQNEIIDNKIKELINIKNSINGLEDSITESMDKGLNNVFIKHNEERYLIKYDYSGRYTHEFDMYLRKALLDVEKKYNMFNLNVAFSACFDTLKNDGNIEYNKTMIKLNSDFDKSKLEDELIIIPKGDYLTLYFDDTYKDANKYYHKIYGYIKENDIEVSGDFNEIYIMTRVGNDDEEKSLAQIDILIKDR